MKKYFKNTDKNKIKQSLNSEPIHMTTSISKQAESLNNNLSKRNSANLIYFWLDDFNMKIISQLEAHSHAITRTTRARVALRSRVRTPAILWQCAQ